MGLDGQREARQRRALRTRGIGEGDAVELDPERLEHAGLVFSGTSPDERLVEVIELRDHPFFVASQFTGREGKYVSIADTIKGFKEIVDGKHDELPEQAFYMVGDIEEAVAKAKTLQ